MSGLKTIETAPSIREIEDAFSEKKVMNPIIRFVGYNENKKEDTYIDEQSGKRVTVSTIKKVIPCDICAKRKKMYDMLLKRVQVMTPKTHGDFVEHWNREKVELIQKLKECPDCHERLASGSKDIDHTTHSHVCEKCGLHFPEELGCVYEGDYVDDSLSRDEENYGMT